MAIKANLVIDQGSDFTTTILLRDESGNLLDLTSYSAAAQMRKTYSSLTAVTLTAQLVTGTSELQISLSDTETANLTPGRYVYDVELSGSGVKTRIVEGIVTVTPEVTKI